MKSDVQRLLRLGLIAEAREAYRRLGNPTLADRLAFLTTESETGHRYELISAIERFHQLPDPNLAAEALRLSGKLSFSHGRLSEGQSFYRKALQVAESAERDTMARVTAGYLNSLLHFESLESALAAFPLLRRATNRAATPIALAEFHLLACEIEIKLGNVLRAERELELAILHLPGAENRILDARASLLAVFLSSYKSDLQEARRHAATALRSARACGARSVLLPALASAAFVAANTGRFEEARELLAQGLEPDISEHARIAMLDTALQSAIARSEIKEAEAIASEIDRSTSAFPAGASLYRAINVPTRIRLLARLEQEPIGPGTR